MAHGLNWGPEITWCRYINCRDAGKAAGQYDASIELTGLFDQDENSR